MVSSEPKKRSLRLASSSPRQGDAFSPAWPYDVDFVLSEDQVWTIGLSEGVGHGAAGRVVSVDEALQTRSLAHIVKAEGSWLVPYLRRLHAGGRVTEEELVEDYLRRHNRLPRVIAESEHHGDSLVDTRGSGTNLGRQGLTFPCPCKS